MLHIIYEDSSWTEMWDLAFENMPVRYNIAFSCSIEWIAKKKGFFFCWAVHLRSLSWGQDGRDWLYDKKKGDWALRGKAKKKTFSGALAKKGLLRTKGLIRSTMWTPFSTCYPASSVKSLFFMDVCVSKFFVKEVLNSLSGLVRGWMWKEYWDAGIRS